MSAAATVACAYAFTAASYAVILTRTALRFLKHESFLLDDCLMLFSMAFYAVNTAMFPIAVRTHSCLAPSLLQESIADHLEDYYGTNFSPHDPHTLTPQQIANATFGSKWLLIGRPFYMSYMWTLKACILIYYARLTARTRDLIAVKFAAGLLVITWIISLLVIFLECRPISLVWQVGPEVPDCARAIKSIIVFCTLNIFTDFVIMIIPLPLIFRAKLPLRTRFEISAVFFIWLAVIAVTIVKMVILLGVFHQRKNLIWTQVECFMATVAANAPVIHGLWRHTYRHIKEGKFGKNACAPPPEYDMNVRAATQHTRPSADVELEEGHETRSRAGSFGSRVHGIRKSIRKMNDRIRRSFEDIHVEQSMIQETRTGRFDHPDDSRAVDAFVGFQPLRSFGTVDTEISVGRPSTPRKSSRAYLDKLRTVNIAIRPAGRGSADEA